MIRWTQRARADLKSIHDFIAKDSLPNAKTVVREILRRADTLEMAPHMGRVVPELRKPELREISAYSWRIIYLPRDGELFIVSVIHHPHDARSQAPRWIQSGRRMEDGERGRRRADIARPLSDSEHPRSRRARPQRAYAPESE